MTDLTLQSPAFENGGRIPRPYGYTAENVNPPLTIAGIPAEAESLVLIVDNPDPGSSTKDVWNHWLVWDIPSSLTEIPEGWEPEEATEGQNDYGEHGYGGPNPTGHEQTYRFRLYALETTLGLPSITEKDDLVDGVVGNIVEKAQLDGTYAP